jgi:hypothetical protein
MTINNQIVLLVLLALIWIPFAGNSIIVEFLVPFSTVIGLGYSLLLLTQKKLEKSPQQIKILYGILFYFVIVLLVVLQMYISSHFMHSVGGPRDGMPL